MAASPPKDRFLSFQCNGLLNEWLTPLNVDGGALTDGENFIYHRDGAWAKRPGAHRTTFATYPTVTPVSGYRWYRAWPNPTTKTVAYARNHLYIGRDEYSFSDLGKYDLSGQYAPCFTSMRDPQARQGQGADILIITGLVLPNGSFGTGQMTISGLPGTQPNGGYITVTLADGNGNTVVTPRYYVTGADNPDSIASNLCQLINASAAFLTFFTSLGFPPFIGESYFTSTTLPYGAPDANNQPQTGSSNPTATIFLGGRYGGSADNNITYAITMRQTWEPTVGVSTLAVSPGTTNFTGGGQSWSGPAKYEPEMGTMGTIGGLSYMAPNAFSFCTTWHQHLWLWNDPGNPDTVFASDIFQPEAYTFMLENGGMKRTRQRRLSGRSGRWRPVRAEVHPGRQRALHLQEREHLHD